jgi:ribosomal protein S18 acetylase RimI-like enzyme
MIYIRNLTTKDVEEMVRVENETWGKELSANRQTLIERLNRYPEGYIGAYIENTLAGMVYGHPIKEIKKTWQSNSDENAFNQEGSIYYIVNVGVSNLYHKKGIGTKLLEETKRYATSKGFNKIVLGSRNIESNISFYSKNGFSIKERVKNYLPDDLESKGVGVIMEYSLQ